MTSKLRTLASGLALSAALLVAALVGLVVFIAVAAGGPFLYAYNTGAPLTGLGWIACVTAFAGMILALLIAGAVLRLRPRSEPPQPKGRD